MPAFNLKTQTLYPSKTKSILFLLLALIFVAMGLSLITKGEKIGWLVTLFFGLAMLVFILNLLPQASYLKLDEAGFETCSLFKKQRYSWKEVSHFGVGKIASNKMVMFNFSAAYPSNE